MGTGRESVVTVGTYDGVHLGHRRLISESLAEGARLGLETRVVTFDRHPAEVLRPERAPKLLTGLGHKLELLGALGVGDPVVLHFDLERAHESAEDFVTEYLLGELGAVSVLVGSNFRFGHRQQGDIALLERLAAELGFSARGIDLVIDDETRTVVSSSLIREQLAAGHVEEAARLLGRPHEVRGALRDGAFEVSSQLCLPAVGTYKGRYGFLGGELAPCQLLVQADAAGAATLLCIEGAEVGAVDPAAPAAARFLARVGGEADASAALAARPDVGR